MNLNKNISGIIRLPNSRIVANISLRELETNVTSVNGKIGDVILTASDIEYIPDTSVKEGLDEISSSIEELEDILNTEISTRYSEDLKLDLSLQEESSLRAAADAELNLRIDSLDYTSAFSTGKILDSISLENGQISVTQRDLTLEDVKELPLRLSGIEESIEQEVQARKEAIESLDFDELSIEPSETIGAISETDGIINVSKLSIQIEESLVTNLISDLEEEANTRQTNDNIISSNLTSEINRASDAEALLASALATETQNRTSADSNLQSLIDTKQPIVSDLETIRSNALAGKDHSEIISGNPHQVTKAEVGLGNVDNTSDINKPISTATQNAITAESERAQAAEEALQQNIDSEVSRATSAESNLSLSISNEVTRATGVEQTLQSSIASEASTRSSEITRVEGLVATEASARTTADNELQEQIDAIESKTDVVDIVASKAELDAYDTSKIYNNDVVKVLEDETKDNAISYYRWVKAESQVGSWLYLGSLGPFYTKAETDTQITNKINALDNSGLTASTGEVISSVSQSDGVISVSKKTLVEADIPTLSQSKITGVSEHTSNTNIHTTSTEKSNWNAKYDKPSSGIPKTDLATSVLTSLGKADTALQAADITGKVDKVNTANKVYGTDASGNQTTYDKNSFGQVDDVKVDGTSVVTNKVANIDLTGKENIANKVTTISSTSTDTQYPSAKAVYSSLNTKLSDAPSDNKQYARKNGTWSEVEASEELKIAPGNNVLITEGTGALTGYKVISATDTTYENKSASLSGTDVSLVTTGEKYTWNNKANNTGVVHNYGDEVISGDKTFLGVIKGTGSETYGTFDLEQGYFTVDEEAAVVVDEYKDILVIADPYSEEGNGKIAVQTSNYEPYYSTLIYPDHIQIADAPNFFGVKLAADALDVISSDGMIHIPYPDIATVHDVSRKQDKLVSGTNIKTINGSSVLGSGNLLVTADNIYKGSSAPTDTSKLWIDTDDTSTQTMSVVEVSATGTSTDEVNYITINGVEKKIGGSGQGISSDIWTVILDKNNWELTEGKYSQTVNTEGVKTTYILMSWTDNPTDSQSEVYSDFEEVKSLSDDTVTVISRSLPAVDVAIKVQTIGSTSTTGSILTAFLDADDWALSEDKYTQTITVAGLDHNLPMTSWIDDPTDSELAAYAEIEDISSNTNNILTVTTSSLPNVDLTIKIKQ